MAGRTISTSMNQDDSYGRKILAIQAVGDRVDDDVLVAFRGFLYQIKHSTKLLSQRQKNWIDEIFQRLDLVEEAENSFSNGTVAIGAATPKIDAFLNKKGPMKPPGR